MAVAGRKLLVTTALEETWGSEESLVFLGEWCKRYERRHVWAQRCHRTVQFHWDDREKLRRDYFYLESLHHTILGSLAASLNEFHQVNHSVRYWQILLDPWLLSYLAVVFDRWESLRRAFEEADDEFDVVVLEGFEQTAAPFSYLEFLASALSDIGNQFLYQRILETEYAGRCVIRFEKRSAISRKRSETKAASKGRRNVLSGLIGYVDCLLGKLTSRYDFVFLGATFNRSAWIRLNLALGQVPRLYLGEFGSPLLESDLQTPSVRMLDRTGLRLDFRPGSRFELFVKNSIVGDLPRCLVEHYPTLQARANGVAIRPKVIVTGGIHWSDAFAKAWFAERVRKGAKLIITEHGGSLPPFRELFGFEEDIADARTNWFLPYHPKHIQLPPARIIGRFPRPQSIFRRRFDPKYCSVIGNECARWAHRAQFYPMAKQWSDSFDMVLHFNDGLDDEIKGFLRVRPAPTFSNQGWNTRQRFSDKLGPGKIFPDQPIDRVFFASKVIVCTYPETTFAEAMASGVPTILMYVEHLYELNPVAHPLLEILRSARIVFTDASTAAAHLNAVWADPDGWWESESVVYARAEFRRQAIDLGGEWLVKWTAFLNRLAA